MWTFSDSGPAVWDDPLVSADDNDKTIAAQGFNNWRASTLYTGAGPMLDMGVAGPTETIIRGTPTPPGHEFETDPHTQGDHHVPMDGWNDHISQTNCSVMQISSPANDDTKVLRTAAHEMGHGMGMNHSGRYETRAAGSGFYDGAADGLQPLLNGNCISAVDANPTVDDWASMTRLIRPSWFAVEPGFESATVSNLAWKGAFNYETIMPAQGAHYVSMQPGGEMGQRVRLNGAPGSYRTTGYFKSNGTGNVSWKVKGRRWTRPTLCDAVTFTDGTWVNISINSSFDTNGATSWETNIGTYGSLGSNLDVWLDIVNNTGQVLFLDSVNLED